MTGSLALARTPMLAQDSIAQRVQRLNCEARQLAHEHIGLLASRMRAAVQMAEEVADGGEAYPPGIRDLARRTAEDCRARALTLELLAKR